MKLFDKIEIIEPHNAMYITEIDAVVIADLHLGYEGIMAEQGIFVPKVQFRKEMQMLKEILKKQKARRIIINGDVKHEFSETSYHEFKEVRDMFIFLKENFEEVTVIKGNHDNFIIYVTQRYGINLCDEFELGNFYFLHGHKMPENTKPKARTTIVAHEHPSIALFDRIGAKEKLSCFLYGRMKNRRNILVLPAFSYLAQGSDVNIIPKEELLSPILKEYTDVDKLDVVGISEETGALKFPKLGKLRFDKV